MWDTKNRNELNRMLLELYEGINTATGTKNKIDAFLDGTGVVTRKMIANNSVDTTKIADGAVTNSRIADESVDHDKLSVDALSMNKGKDFPLKSVDLGGQKALPIATHVKNIVLDAKVFGALPGMYYRLTFVANGIISGGSQRYGITVEERRISDGAMVRYVFHYSDAF